MDPRSDEALLAEHVRGSAGAFDVLVARHAGELLGFLARFVGDPAAGEDLVQETFVQVHLAANTFDSERRFRPWLYTIAANKARDYLRTRGRRAERSLDAGDDDAGGLGRSLAAEEPPLADALTDEELRRAVQDVVARLPEHMRTILLLGYFQQLPYAEIADVLSVPIGTVKSRLHAAVQQFARLWRARGGAATETPGGLAEAGG